MNNFDLKSNSLIEERLKEFEALNKAENKLWFSELCFCILTANSKALNAIQIQNEIGADGFINKTQDEIKAIIKANKHRFHNNKAKYIIEARKFLNIKQVIQGFSNSHEAREFIAKNIKGLGYKEKRHIFYEMWVIMM